jgi:hypothetical protein
VDSQFANRFCRTQAMAPTWLIGGLRGAEEAGVSIVMSLIA